MYRNNLKQIFYSSCYIVTAQTQFIYVNLKAHQTTINNKTFSYYHGIEVHLYYKFQMKEIFLDIISAGRHIHIQNICSNRNILALLIKKKCYKSNFCQQEQKYVDYMLYDNDILAGLIHKFLHKKMSVQSKDYDSFYPFV